MLCPWDTPDPASNLSLDEWQILGSSVKGSRILIFEKKQRGHRKPLLDVGIKRSTKAPTDVLAVFLLDLLA